MIPVLRLVAVHVVTPENPQLPRFNASLARRSLGEGGTFFTASQISL
jgi:hypothetical protein